MLTMGDFETVAGATAITLAIVKLITAVWPSAPRVWLIWAASEATVFAGGIIRGAVTGTVALELFFSGMVVAAAALCVLEWGPGKPSTTNASVNMTMAFAIVSLSAVNVGLVMRRERQAPWSPPVFPYLGWIILGWFLTWAAVGLNMLQRLLGTTSLSGREWVVVLALSLLAPGVVAGDKALHLLRQRRNRANPDAIP